MDNFINRLRAARLADPDAVDSATIDLLTSGRLSVGDISNLYNRYTNNATMRGLIGAEAQRRADVEQDTDDRRALAAIAYDSRQVWTDCAINLNVEQAGTCTAQLLF